MANAGQIILPYGDVPNTPSSGKIAFYSKDNKLLYYKTDDGVEYPVATISGTSHGDLSGLDADDHTQYLLADGTRELTGNLTVASGVTIGGYNLSDLVSEASNLGSGEYVYYQKVGQDLQFKSIKADSSKITMSSNDTEVTVDVNQANIDHGSIDGLSDDDHSQYLRTDGTRELSGDWDYGSNTISGTGRVIAGLIDLDYLDFNSDLVDPIEKTGRLFWDRINHCLSIYDADSDTTLQIGQENYVRIINNNSYEIPNGSAVYINGSTVGLPTVDLSIASNLDIQGLGVATCDITASGGIGFITTFGMINDIDTHLFLPGDKLYTSSTISGALTNIEPTSPNRVSQMGWCITAAESGRILVFTRKSDAMSTLADVNVNSAVTDDLLVYNTATGMWNPENKSAHEHDADQIYFDNTVWLDYGGFEEDNLNYVVNEINEYLINGLGSSGRLFSDFDVITKSTPYTIVIASGIGHTVKNDKHYDVAWDGVEVDTTGYAEGFYYVYVDESEVVTITGIEPDYLDTIYLGGFYCTSLPTFEGFVAEYHDSGLCIDDSVSRISRTLYNLGPFVLSGGIVGLIPGEPLKIVSTACSVQNVLRIVSLDEVDSTDTDATFNEYMMQDNNWHPSFYHHTYEEGRISTTLYNDTTASGLILLTEDCIFTTGSGIVTSTVNLTSEVLAGDFISASLPASYMYECLVVSGVEWTGSQTNIPLAYNYAGPTVTGTAYITRVAKEIPDGKWAKHLVTRTLDGGMHLVYGQTYFDTEAAALAGALPLIPPALEKKTIRVAALVFEKGETDLTGKIVDLRPLPINLTSGGGGGVAVGGGALTDHGALTGLGDDDHTQYLTSARGNAVYYTKTQLNAGQLDNRYYTETELDAGQLDNRYYTETEIDTISGSINNAYIAADTTLSGILNDKITTLNDTVANYGMLVIDAADMVPATTSGSLAGTYEYSTNKIDFDYFAFGGGITKERVLFKLSMPENWDRGTIKAKFHWSSATGSTAGDTVEWALKSGALSDSDAIDAALGTPQVISDALLADNGADLQITSTTPAITVGGSPTLGDMLVFEVYRNTDGTDDMAEDSWLFGVRIQYKIDNSVVVW